MGISTTTFSRSSASTAAWQAWPTSAAPAWRSASSTRSDASASTAGPRRHVLQGFHAATRKPGGFFQSGVAARAFKALADTGVNLRAITTSEIKFSVLIDEAYAELAVRTLHALYGLDTAA